MHRIHNFRRAHALSTALCSGLACLALAGGSAANAQIFGEAGGYNLFTFGNASNINVDILGDVAVGGNASFNNYSIGSGSGNGPNAAVVGGNYTNSYGTVDGSVIAGGNILVTDPSVFGNLDANGSVTLNSYGEVTGAIKYGTTFTNNNSYTLGSSVSKGTTALPVNFGTDQSTLDSLSSSLDGLAANGLVNFQYGALNLTGSGSQEVFDITAAQLAAATSGTYITAGSGATVIINVTGGSGSSFTIPNSGFSVTGTSTSDVIFNFVNATAINVGSWYTSILAPDAVVTGQSGDFHGNLIADSFVGNGLELHNDDLFSGTVTGLPGVGTNVAQPTPEPGVFVTAASLLAATGLGLAQGRRRAKLG